MPVLTRSLSNSKVRDVPQQIDATPKDKGDDTEGTNDDLTFSASARNVLSEPLSTPITPDEEDGVVVEGSPPIDKTDLEIMYDIIMRIRNDEAFAKAIYKDSPRLQYLLDKHPDLRPIFEEPRFVRINFEEVYRKHGGRLPEDKPPPPPTRYERTMAFISRIVNHPLYRVFRVLMFFKKMVNCILGGGFALLTGFFASMCHCNPFDCLGPPHDLPPGPDPADAANKEALLSAAQYMEDPDVQEHMQEVLASNDPDALQEAIDNDPQLSALRDSNPLVAEMMSDPDTCQVLTNPDNLRALADAPELINQDIADPNWEPPPDVDVEAPDVDTPDVNPQDGVDTPDADAYASNNDNGTDFEIDNNNNNVVTREAARNRSRNNNRDEGGGGMSSGLLAGITMAATDILAQQVLGIGVNELAGADDSLSAFEQLDGNNNDVTNMVGGNDSFITGSAVDGLEDGADRMQDMDEQDREAKSRAKSMGSQEAQGFGASLDSPAEGDDEESGGGARMGVLGTMAYAAKRTVASTLLGDDFGEDLVDHMYEKKNQPTNEGAASEREAKPSWRTRRKKGDQRITI